MDAGEFLVTVELDPPRGHNIEKLVQGAKLLKERGVEIVDINDGSLGRVRMSVLPTAILVREATGLDINMHFTCRDRNLMGIQADLLGAHAMDIRNILAMTGDPPRTGDYVNATAVFDVDAIGLIRVLASMNLGLDATGLDINMHFTCRDRNLMGIQADLLGAHAMDIRNILAMTGDPPRTGDYVNATAVFDVDAIGLIRILAEMNRGLDATGTSIGEPTSFSVGVALNPASEEPTREMERFLAKVEAGARWVQTQPLYDLEVLDRFFARTRPPIPLVVGIMPLHSSRHAEFLHNEVPGITVPDAVRARMKEAGERGLRAGIEMAQGLLRDVRVHRHSGVYLMPSFGRFEVVAEVLDALH